uniref:Uncharacterized protein n=1 Tax=Anguilla anguilla TaxID=7936 RepID=A0A0E9Y0P3_ANGAN
MHRDTAHKICSIQNDFK